MRARPNADRVRFETWWKFSRRTARDVTMQVALVWFAAGLLSPLERVPPRTNGGPYTAVVVVPTGIGADSPPIIIISCTWKRPACFFHRIR